MIAGRCFSAHGHGRPFGLRDIQSATSSFKIWEDDLGRKNRNPRGILLPSYITNSPSEGALASPSSLNKRKSVRIFADAISFCREDDERQERSGPFLLLTRDGGGRRHRARSETMSTGKGIREPRFQIQLQMNLWWEHCTSHFSSATFGCLKNNP